jgi:hypothetical protein
VSGDVNSTNRGAFVVEGDGSIAADEYVLVFGEELGGG